MLYALVGFLGLILGYFIASKTQEELKQGEKYFKILGGLLLLIIIIFLIIKLSFFNIEFLIALFIGLILNYFIKKIYLFLGLSLVLLDKYLLSLIIFIFGLTYGTLDYMRFNKVNYKVILINLILFFIPITIFLNKFTMIFDTILIGFALGGIIIELTRLNPRFKEKKRTSGHR